MPGEKLLQLAFVVQGEGKGAVGPRLAPGGMLQGVGCVQLLGSLGTNEATEELVHDLMANARRRGREGRYGDAVARLYRAIEAMAQHRLDSEYGIKTSGVPYDQVPEELARRWWDGAGNGGGSVGDEVLEPRKIGLREAYTLLEHFGDDLALRFRESVVETPKNEGALTARNMSILAHGFQPVGEKVYERLWSATLHLADVSEQSLPRFPRLKLARQGLRSGRRSLSVPGSLSIPRAERRENGVREREMTCIRTMQRETRLEGPSGSKGIGRTDALGRSTHWTDRTDALDKTDALEGMR